MNRRRLLTGGALTAGGMLAGAGLTSSAFAPPSTPNTDEAGTDEPIAVSSGEQIEAFHGEHQAGIATDAQAFGTFLAFDLRPGIDRAALQRLMRLLSDDAVRLTAGRPALADVQPELAELPNRLTVTFGFGPGLFAAAGQASPVEALPPLVIDQLEGRWSGGDLVIQLCADDPMTVGHAQRVVLNDTKAFATLRWTQRGFRRSRGTHDAGVTQRNVFGQLDGTRNPRPGTTVFDDVVWIDEGPLRGGTTLVVRRIRADMDGWDAADSAAKELAVGRSLATGAPLTGVNEHDEPDFAQLNSIGLPVIPEFSHIARARVLSDRQRIFRRPYNFDETPSSEGRPDTGLIFAAYQRDVVSQFLPIQRNLAEIDLLNEWTTPIGSAVFAVPSGCAEGGWIGETVLG